MSDDIAQKAKPKARRQGGFGSLFINYHYFFLVNMIAWWGFILTD